MMLLLFRWLLHFMFPLCLTTGTAGIAAPGVVDLAHFTRAAYSTALIAPPGFAATPDLIAPAFPVPAAKLFGLLQAVAHEQERTYVLDVEPGANQAAFVVRSRAANFPDVVEVAAIALGPASSTYMFYSHALYGWYAYRVNINRAETWAAALEEKVSQQQKVSN